MSGVDALMENHDWENDLELSEDWWKASWELFVERELFFGHYLGSLSINMNSRVISPKALADYVIVAKSKQAQLKTVLTNEVVPILNGLRIIGFLSVYKETNFGYYPPFDVAELYNDKNKTRYCVWLKDLVFFAISLDEYMKSL